MIKGFRASPFDDTAIFTEEEFRSQEPELRIEFCATGEAEPEGWLNRDLKLPILIVETKKNFPGLETPGLIVWNILTWKIRF